MNTALKEKIVPGYEFLRTKFPEHLIDLILDFNVCHVNLVYISNKDLGELILGHFSPEEFPKFKKFYTSGPYYSSPFILNTKLDKFVIFATYIGLNPLLRIIIDVTWHHIICEVCKMRGKYTIFELEFYQKKHNERGILYARKSKDYYHLKYYTSVEQINFIDKSRPERCPMLPRYDE